MPDTPEDVGRRIDKLEVRIDEVVIPKLDKVVAFVDNNSSGIKTASLLNDKILTVVITAIISLGAVYLSKGL